MSDILMLEKVVAVLCLGHIAINCAIALERIKLANTVGLKWEVTIGFPTIAAIILSACAVARWALA